MKPIFLALLCLLGTAASAIAKDYELPAGKPLATITLPDSWKQEPITRGIQAQTADGDVYLSVEFTDNASEMNAVIDETDAMLKQRKVSLDKTHHKDSKFKLKDLPAEELLYTGTDENGPTMVSITFVTIRNAALVFTYWASFEGNKKHQSELGGILNSLKVTGK